MRHDRGNGFYANGHLEALNSSSRGRLSGMGMAPEGIENNDVIYELVTDAAWRDRQEDVEQYLENYCRARYGNYPDSMKEAWNLFRRTAYSNLKDHPRFNWQMKPGTRGCSVNTSEDFLKGLSLFVNTRGLEQSPLFRQDAVEMTAHYLGIRMNEAILAALEALDEQDMENTKNAWNISANTPFGRIPFWKGIPPGDCRAGYHLPGLTELLLRKKQV